MAIVRDIAWLLSKVDKQANGCWLWTGHKGTDGYGNVEISCNPRRRTKAHRYAYQLFKGDIAPGLVLCHHCDVRLCVNPDHVFVGTRLDNYKDSVSKDRACVLTGEQNIAAKLNAEQVYEIRRLKEQGESGRSVAARFGVTKTLVNLIAKRRIWKHLKKF